MGFALIGKLNDAARCLAYMKEPERTWILGYLLGMTGAEAFDESFLQGLKAGKSYIDAWEDFTSKNPDGYSTPSEQDEEDDNGYCSCE